MTSVQTPDMTVKVGISLPDTTLSGLVDTALRAELTRRDLADHVAMLAEADDPARLRERAQRRAQTLAGWKAGR